VRVKFRVLRVKFQVLRVKFRVLRVKFRVLRVKFQVLKVKFRVLKVKFRVLRVKFRVLRVKFRVLRVIAPKRYCNTLAKGTLNLYASAIRGSEWQSQSQNNKLHCTAFNCKLLYLRSRSRSVSEGLSGYSVRSPKFLYLYS